MLLLLAVSAHVIWYTLHAYCYHDLLVTRSSAYYNNVYRINVIKRIFIVRSNSIKMGFIILL